MENFMISISDDYLSKIEDISKELEKLGFKTNKILRNLGIITGSIADVNSIKNIEGIASIEKEITMTHT